MFTAAQLRTSPTLALNELSARLAAQGRTVHRFGFGQSPFPPPAEVVEALRENAWRRDYLPVQGLPLLRESVAQFHRERNGLGFCADDVVIGPGSKELLFLLQLAYGGELLLPSPSWVSYEPQARLLGLPVTWLRTEARDGWRIDPEELDRACRKDADLPRLLILNYPNNPTGAVLDQARLEAIAEVARRRQLLVVSDEIYGELHHEGKHDSLATFYPEGTVVTGGLSKWCGAGGWRLGTMCIPEQWRELRQAICCAASETFSGVNAPVQYAALTAYAAGPEIEQYLRLARQVLRTVGRSVGEELNRAGIPTARPDGGFYVFPDFSPFAQLTATPTSTQFAHALLQTAGVALLPGVDFGRPAEELTCRLAYVNFDGAAAMEAARRTGVLDENFLRAHCPAVTAGLAAIIAYIARLAKASAGEPF